MKKNLILAATVALLTAGTVRSAQTQANTNITNATSPTAATLRTADVDSVYSKGGRHAGIRGRNGADVENPD